MTPKDQAEFLKHLFKPGPTGERIRAKYRSPYSQVVQEEQNKDQEESLRGTSGSMDISLAWTSIHIGDQTPWWGGIPPSDEGN